VDKYTGGLLTSNNANGMNEAASSSKSVQSPVPWKKARQDLLSKHVHSTGTGDREIQLYRCLCIAPDGDVFPVIAKFPLLLPLLLTTEYFRYRFGFRYYKYFHYYYNYVFVFPLPFPLSLLMSELLVQ